MKIRLFPSAITLGVCLMASRTLAHHSMGTYDQSAFVTIKGTVTRVEWRNPHSWITLVVSNTDGTISTHRIEIAGPSCPDQKRLRQKPRQRWGLPRHVESWMPKDPRYGNIPNGRILTLADGRRVDVGDNWGVSDSPGNQPR